MRGPRIGGRPTADTVILLLAVTVCASLVLAGLGITVVTLLRPELDTTDVIRPLVEALQNTLFTVLGVAAGRYMGTETPPWQRAGGTVPPATDNSSDTTSGDDAAR